MFADESGIPIKLQAFDSQNRTLLWQKDIDDNLIYRNFEVIGNTVKADYSIWTSIGGGVALLDLQTGQSLWGTGSGRIGGTKFLYTDGVYGYSIEFSSGAPSVLGPIVQFDMRAGERSNVCNFDVNPPVLSQRYIFSPDLPYGLNAMLRGIVTDGEWIYATVENDLHRFPLCGATPAFSESVGEAVKSDTSGKRKRYKLPTVLYSWNHEYGRYFSLNGGGVFAGESDLTWIAGPSEGVFLFYSDKAEGLYGVNEVPQNCIEVIEDKLVGDPTPCDSENVIIREYPGIGNEISRLDVIDGMIFVGTVNGVFHVFDLHTQELIFRTRVNSPNFGPFHLVDDIAIVQTLNGDVMAFKLDLPKQE